MSHSIPYELHTRPFQSPSIPVPSSRPPSCPTPNSPSDGSGSSSAQGPGTTSDDLVTALAFPNSNSLSLDGVLSTESTGISGVLGDFNLLDLLT